MPLTFNVSRDEFLAALGSLQNIVGKKGTIAILANILIEGSNDTVVLTATDLETGIRITLPAEVMSQGALTLPGKKLFELVRASEAEVIHVEEGESYWARISADITDYSLAGMSAEEFPAFPEYDQEKLVSLSSEVLAELVDKTLFSVALEGETQFNLTGVLVEREMIEEGQKLLRMVSSDGHRLSLMEAPVSGEIEKLAMEDRTILIPRRGIQELRKFCETADHLSLGFDEKQAVVQGGNAVLVIRLMNGDFPDYRNIIQVINKAKYININRTLFINSLKRVNLFTEDRFHAVHFNIEKNKIILSSQNIDIGSAKEEISVEYEGETMNLGFNGKYFIEALQVMKSEYIKAYINSEESPCLIQGDDDPGYLSVIMPMKI